MSLFNLSDIKTKPSRSGFDLSTKVAFTAKVGELLPVRWMFTMPGDKFTLKRQHFTRTQPVNTSAYTRVREYYDWFYVPLHLLWRHAPEVIAQIQKNAQHATSMSLGSSLGDYLPCVTCSDLTSALKSIDSSSNGVNQFGFNRVDLAYKLIQYLRYGNVLDSNFSRNYGTSVPKDSDYYSQVRRWDLTLSVFPLLAYKKFCQDYFRYTQWQDSQPYLWNIDYYDARTQRLSLPSVSDSYWNNNTLFDLEYCNWNKDLFLGVLPDTQYGDVSSISVLGSDAVYDLSYQSIGGQSGDSVTIGSKATTPGALPNDYYVNFQPGSVSPGNSRLQVRIPSSDFSFDILALRRGEALQRWKEVSLNNSQNYRSQIKAHFGVDLGDNMSGMSTYVTGDASSIDISEVLNTNLATDTDIAHVAGKGVGSGSHSDVFTANDWGILMCIYHSIPLLDYVSTAPDPQLFATQNTDLPIPELDSIGMQSIPVSYYSNSALELNPLSSYLPTQTMGYLPRYYQWKTSYDYVLGAFTTTEKEWVAPFTPDIWKTILYGIKPGSPNSYKLFKVNPSIMDSIFQVNADSTWDTDTFLINCAFDIKVARNLDYSGMPY